MKTTISVILFTLFNFVTFAQDSIPKLNIDTLKYLSPKRNNYAIINDTKNGHKLTETTKSVKEEYQNPKRHGIGINIDFVPLERTIIGKIKNLDIFTFGFGITHRFMLNKKGIFIEDYKPYTYIANTIGISSFIGKYTSAITYITDIGIGMNGNGMRLNVGLNIGYKKYIVERIKYIQVDEKSIQEKSYNPDGLLLMGNLEISVLSQRKKFPYTIGFKLYSGIETEFEHRDLVTEDNFTIALEFNIIFFIK